MINPSLLSSMWERNAQYWTTTDPGGAESPLPVRRPALPAWHFDKADVAREDRVLTLLAYLTAKRGSSWEAATQAFDSPSTGRSAQKLRWQMLRHQWPDMARVKTTYHRHCRRRAHRD
ncbi:hypothetical protein ACFYY8_31395 [Streptosporangium sp. NPDC001559]|uniref:hypothetical protein n=1 Tax=Streptosporangium sp. NPDC001559 TaxID=3366187 RepID=UPI0036ED62A2